MLPHKRFLLNIPFIYINTRNEYASITAKLCDAMSNDGTKDKKSQGRIQVWGASLIFLKLRDYSSK